MNKNDVLTRAKKIIENGPLPESHNEHGQYCPYCAIALAKDQLDGETGEGVPFDECLKQMVFGYVEFEEDKPLTEARVVIGKISEPFTKEATLDAFTAALASLEEI